MPGAAIRAKQLFIPSATMGVAEIICRVFKTSIAFRLLRRRPEIFIDLRLDT